MIRIVGDVQIFKDIVSAVLVMAPEARIIVRSEGVQINVSSIDHTAAVFITAPKELFKTYEVPTNVEFGIKADELKKRLAFLDKDVTIEVDSEVRVLSGRTRYTIPLFDVEAFRTLPKIDFASQINMKYPDFKKTVSAIGVVSETLSVETSEGKVLFSGKGELPSDKVEREPEEFIVQGAGKSAYSLSYIEKMVGAVEVESVVFQFRDKGDLQLTLGNVIYLLGGKMRQ